MSSRLKGILAGAAVVGLLACSSGGGSTAGTGGATSTAGTGGSAGSDTWTSYAEGFFTMYCVECHSPTTDPTRDFTQYAMVRTNAPTIRCGVAPTVLSGCSAFPPPKQFPISDASGTNPKPTDAERDRIVAWIEAGTPQ